MLQNRSPTFHERTTQFAHSGATTALTPLLINGHLVIPLNTALANALNSFLIEAEISDYSQAAVDCAAFDRAYWDNGASKFTNVASGNTACGYFIEASASGTGAGIIRVNSFANSDSGAVANLNAWATALATKLNADAGVTDTNYDTDPQS